MLDENGVVTYPWQGYFRQADDIFANPQSVFPRAAVAPTTGLHAVGEIVWNNAPLSGGYIGWVCTVAGTPGTWATWGPIT